MKGFAIAAALALVSSASPVMAQAQPATPAPARPAPTQGAPAAQVPPPPAPTAQPPAPFPQGAKVAFVNLQATAPMAEGSYIADLIATLAMLDPVLGGIDR